MKTSLPYINSFAAVVLAASSIPLAQAETIKSESINSASIEASEIEQQVHSLKHTALSHSSTCNCLSCSIFVDPHSSDCFAPNDKAIEFNKVLPEVIS